MNLSHTIQLDRALADQRHGIADQLPKIRRPR